MAHSLTELRGDGASTSPVAQSAAAAPARDPDGRGQGTGWRLIALAFLLTGIVLSGWALYIPVKAEVAQVLLARAWASELKTGQPTRPWAWADFTPAAKLDFPAQHRSVLALTDASGDSLAFGPSLLAASARPGEPGVAVFAAHRDTHFAFLGQLKAGDLVSVETREGKVAYRITGSEVVRWNASGIAAHDRSLARIALVTCWPLDANLHGPWRYVVWGERSAG